MPEADLSIIIQARDTATGQLRKVSSEFEALQRSLKMVKVDDLNKSMQAADKAIGKVGTTASNASGPVNGLFSSLQRVGEIATGLLVAQAIPALIGGIRSMVGQAIDAYASFERLSMSLQTLVANELIETKQAGDMSEALGMAGSRADELVKWTQKLAIESPFTQETVARTLQVAMSYGMTSDMAQKMTQSLLDFSAGAGKSESEMQQLGLALGQVWAKGKLSGQEMLQLTNAGIGVAMAAKAAGIAQEDFAKAMENGEIKANTFVPALMALIDERFAGGAKRQATSWAGLLSTLSDIKEVGLREFFAGTFKAIQPYVANFVDLFSSEAFIARIREIGELIGGKIGGALAYVQGIANTFQSGGMTGLMGVLGFGEGDIAMIQAVIGFVQSLAQQALPLLGQALAFVQEHSEEVKGALIAIGAILAGVAIVAGIAAIVAAIAAIANPIGLVIAAVALLGAAWAGNWGDIQGKTTAVVEFISGIIGTAVSRWATWWDAHGDSVMRILGAFWKSVQRGFQIIADVVSDILGWLGGIWQDNASWITQIWQTAWQNIQTIASAFMSILGSIFDAFAAAFSGDWRTFGQKLREAWDTAWEAIETVLRNSFDTMTRLAGELAQAIWDKITTTDWPAVGRSIVDGLIQGILNNWWSFVNTIRDLASAAWEAIKGFFGISSPSKLMMKIGQNVVEGFALGIRQNAALPAMEMRGVASPMPAIAASAGGSSLTMNNTYNVSSAVDIELLAYRVAEVIRRHR